MITKFIRIFIENPNLIIVLILIIIGAKFTEDWLERKNIFRIKSSIKLVLMYVETVAIVLSLFPFEHYLKSSPKLIIYTTIAATYIFVVVSIIFIMGLIYYLIRDIKKTPNNSRL